MTRLLLAVALSILAVPALAAGSASLKQNVVVTGEAVRLGDLFDNAGPKAGLPIAKSPAPGQKVNLDANWLATLAASHGVDWKPTSVMDRTTVERPGRDLPRAELEQAILAALAPEGVQPKSEVDLANRTLQITLPADGKGALTVRDVSYDPRSNRFQVTLEYPGEGSNMVRERVGGTVHRVVDVPVLTRAVGKGETIGATDLDWVRLRGDSVRNDTLVDASQILGYTAKSFIRPGQQIRAMDLQRPIAVAKGALVTMVLKSGAMQLTAQGRAVEEGAIGDVIRVTNTHSKQTVEAKVEAPNIVSVQPAGTVHLSN